MNILFLYFTSLIISNPFLSALDHIIVNTVDHKNTHLNTYLDLIQFNTHEKNEILSYILKQKHGIYLEIGTGGDPIADLLSKIPENHPATIIACDIDPYILQTLPNRHPHLLKYLNNPHHGPCLILQQLDATCMSTIKDNSLAGINASAIVHEIVSYAGGIQGLEKFFLEALRVLDTDGILIYRDPESVHDKDRLVHVSFHNKAIKLFSHIFLPKFLDTQYSKLAQAGRKYTYYSQDSITILCYLKNSLHQSCLSYAEYLKIPCHQIDFTKPYNMQIPQGLCREIARHYLTYLHQCNPLVFVKCLPNLDSQS